MLHTTTQLAETKDKFGFLEIAMKPKAVPPAGLCLLLRLEEIDLLMRFNLTS